MVVPSTTPRPRWVNQLVSLPPVGLMEDSVVEWFRALDLSSGGPWLKSFTLLLSGIVLGSPEYNSSTALGKPIGQPHTSWAYGGERGRVVSDAGFEIWRSLVKILHLLLTGLVLGSPKFNSSTTLCK